jgi:hypothetical protein
MRERFTRLGIAPCYHAHARHFMALAKDWGMSAADIDAHLSFAAQLPEHLSGDEISARYTRFATERGVDPNVSDLAISWRDEVSERGIEGLPPPAEAAVTDTDRARVVEIRAEMAKPKGGSLYWRTDEKGEAMRDEYLALIERMGEGVHAPFTPPPTGNDTARKTEIESAMQQGSHGPYWQSEAMQNEYRAIIERQTTNANGETT